jgi:hypothetical protein
LPDRRIGPTIRRQGFARRASAVQPPPTIIMETNKP